LFNILGDNLVVEYIVSDDTGFVDPWVAQTMAPKLTERDMQFRDKFVAEYLVDYNPVAAAIRCGLTSAFAKDYAQRFMGEPYVQQEIKRLEGVREGDTEDDAQEKRDKAKIKSMLFREASGASPGSTASARVAALSKLMSLYGMDAPVKTEAKVEHTGKVQIYLPDNGRDVTPAAVAAASAVTGVPGNV
jgi:hypothetical protein